MYACHDRRVEAAALDERERNGTHVIDKQQADTWRREGGGKEFTLERDGGFTMERQGKINRTIG